MLDDSGPHGAEYGQNYKLPRERFALSSTSYYNQNRDTLFEQYHAYDPEVVHRAWAPEHLKGRKPGFACDIGAGTGRDANWLAEQGWEVLAVEPSDLREPGEGKSDPRVTWLDDTLPDLQKLRALGRRFDLILLRSVWMHVPRSRQERAFRILTELLNPSGLLVISLRHGSDEEENRSRGFHPVSADDLIRYARDRAISLRGQYEHPDRSRDHVHWEWLVFEMPDDGTGNLPLLRHVIVNDDKSSTYKLGLLRTLVRLAETAPGIVTKRTDEFVYLPFGAVGLYWLKLYAPLILQHGLPQLPRNVNPAFATDEFCRLIEWSFSDLRLGTAVFNEQAVTVTRAISAACMTIKKMPAHFITFPGSSKQVFDCEYRSPGKPGESISLSLEYLSKFGEFRVPAQLWQTLGQFACWLDPVILREWRQLTIGWGWGGVKEVSMIDNQAFEWGEARRDTTLAFSRAQEMKKEGFPLHCTWSAKRIGSSLHIDHCFPWARWRNNDLWNLLPATASVNNQKSDKLPSAETLAEAKGRIVDWWTRAWLDGPREEQFFMEAIYSLPGLARERPSLEEIHLAARHQRARLRQDQQIAEWVLNPQPA